MLYTCTGCDTTYGQKARPNQKLHPGFCAVCWMFEFAKQARVIQKQQNEIDAKSLATRRHNMPRRETS